MIELAYDHSLETRIRRLIEVHREGGDEPRTLVMNTGTWHALVDELEGRTYNHSYYWYPTAKGDDKISFFLGVPILLKDFVADMEVLVGV